MNEGMGNALNAYSCSMAWCYVWTSHSILRKMQGQETFYIINQAWVEITFLSLVYCQMAWFTWIGGEETLIKPSNFISCRQNWGRFLIKSFDSHIIQAAMLTAVDRNCCRKHLDDTRLVNTDLELQLIHSLSSTMFLKSLPQYQPKKMRPHLKLSRCYLSK